MKYLTAAVVIGAALIAGGCTENARSRNFGGESTIDVPCGQKVFNITWKEANLWYAIRPMRNDEKPEIYTFKEDSNMGILEGTVTFKESSCPPTG
jgi:hypothetical protein